MIVSGITKLDVVAIVTVADRSMFGGGGVVGTSHHATGKGLQKM